MAPAPHPPLTPFGSALAGALGSVFANAAVYPLDTVKTRLQAEDDEDEDDEEDDEERDNEVDLPTTNTAKRIKRWGMFMMLLKILKKEGISGAFHGFGASMIGTFSQQFAYFFFHTLLRTSYLRRLSLKTTTSTSKTIINSPSISTSAELFIGALAGAFAQIFTIPVQVIATRQQLWQPSISSSKDKKAVIAPSLFETANEIINENGITGLWTGLKPGLVLTINPAITYGVFERLKSYRLSKRLNGNHNIGKGGKLGVGESFILGMISKTLATVVTYPYIFAKVRLQAKKNKIDEEDIHLNKNENLTPSYASIASISPPKFGSSIINLPKNQFENLPLNKKQNHKLHHHHKHHKHALSLLKSVYIENGFKGWYKGLTAQIIKAVLCQGILFVSKDQFESYVWILMIFLNNLKKRISSF
uniref:Adenine nucleotide transporter n=1 Tax=Kwoniella pini CBS 10737 TaxID=1296096 RepID=A0A1B9HV05_9TREE|nr:uncharacterized protein I206_06876 [Kwoniella pini CBS 10737]OCF47100.1 hypothetical protein I206_06876 [Kwoniella pini CBS 10737]